MILTTNPMTGDGGIFAGGLPKQTVQSLQPLLGDGGLPSPVAASFGELVENAASFGKGVLAALGDQQHVHRARFPISDATAFTVSIMKSSDSVRDKLSMQAWRKVCSSSPRVAEMA